MPEVVASRQNQQNQHKQAIKAESTENANGEESASMSYILILRFFLTFHYSGAKYYLQNNKSLLQPNG